MRAERERRRRKYVETESLLDYIPRMSPGYSRPVHLTRYAECLEACAVGNVRVICNVPPRHGKTETILHAIAWLLRKHPEMTIGYATYGQGLATSKSDKARRLALASGVQLSDTVAKLTEWRTTAGGGVLAAGVKGGWTGHGIDCFAAGTMVKTPAGHVPIESVAVGDEVLSCSVETGKIEVSYVEAVNARPARNGMVELETRSGRRVRATRDHRLWSPSRMGWVRAGDLQEGDTLACAPGLLPLRGVWHPPSESAGRLCQGATSTPAAAHMRNGVPGDLAAQRTMLSDMRKAGSQTGREVLLSAMSAQPGDPQKSDLSGVLHDFPAEVSTNTVLLSGLRGRGPRRSNEGAWKSSLQDGKELQQTLSIDASLYSGARSPQVRELLRRGEAARPPHRRGSDKQPSGESDRLVRDLPHGPSQVEADTVCRVVDDSGRGERVYDLQVAKTHCFFAEGILAHNCLFIDDPFKNRLEAESKLIRNRVREFFQDSALTRLEPKASVVINHTRWHGDDLSGWLLKEADKGGEPYEHLRYQALDDTTKEALWPERYNEDDLRRIQIAVGAYTWDSLYRNDPRPRGATLFDGTAYYDRLPTGPHRIGLGVDLAYSESSKADWSVLVVMMEFLATPGLFYVVDVVRKQVKAPRFARDLKEANDDFPGAPMLFIHGGGGESGVASFLKAAPHHIRIKLESASSLGDKFTRAQPLAAAWNEDPEVEGDVPSILLPRTSCFESCPEDCEEHDAPVWVDDFVDELLDFSGAKTDTDDQVDAAVAAHRALARKRIIFATARG